MVTNAARIARATAAIYGIEPAWTDTGGGSRVASEATIRSALAELGAPVTETSDLADAARARRSEIWQRPSPPVRVVRPGRPTAVRLRIADPRPALRIDWSLVLEGAGAVCGVERYADLPLVGGRQVDGQRFEIRHLELPGPTPPGYHRLILRFGSREWRAHVICAPSTTWRGKSLEGSWGFFHPMYGLPPRSGREVADFGALRQAMDWTAGQGGAVFATTPLLAMFDTPPVDPSPYAPASRLFWNDLYVDLEDEAADPLPDLVPYERLLPERDRLLARRAEAFFAAGGGVEFDFMQFLRQTSEIQSFARFMAASRLHGRDWRSWPARCPEVEPGLVRRYLFGQWQAARQMAVVAEAGRAGLYLDFPLGAHADGYDVWRRPGLFAEAHSIGSPPDDFHRRGQDWGLPPPLPDAMRDGGYEYFAAALRHTMKFASMVRIDHVMQLRRLYWVPAGCDPAEGVYVRYAARELAAVIALESRRAACEVTGEDLGTVPEDVRDLMTEQAVRRTWVLGFSLPEAPGELMRAVPAEAVATIGIHDMPPLRGLRAEVDIDDRVDLGLLDGEEAAALRRDRELRMEGLSALSDPSPEDPDGGPDPALPGVLRELRRSGAGLVLLPLDDLVGTQGPQNVPGTTVERPNWRRRLPADLAAIGAAPGSARVLDALRGAAE